MSEFTVLAPLLSTAQSRSQRRCMSCGQQLSFSGDLRSITMVPRPPGFPRVRSQESSLVVFVCDNEPSCGERAKLFIKADLGELFSKYSFYGFAAIPGQ